MKLSEILKDWPEKEELSLVSPSDYDMSQLADDTHKYIRDLEILTENQDTALTSCDREIDREALAKVFYQKDGVFTNWEDANTALRNMYFAKADHIISTMPKWLKPTERKIEIGNIRAERSHLVPLNELEVTKLLMKVKNDYDNLTDFEKVRLPIGGDGPRLYAEAICKKFGTPNIKWPVKCVCICQRDEMPEFEIDCVCGAKEYNEGIDACRRADEEAWVESHPKDSVFLPNIKELHEKFNQPKDAVSVEEFKIIARETAQKVYSYLNIDGIADSIAQAIHDLINRKLKGQDNEDFNE